MLVDDPDSQEQCQQARDLIASHGAKRVGME